MHLDCQVAAKGEKKKDKKKNKKDESEEEEEEEEEKPKKVRAECVHVFISVCVIFHIICI